MPIKKLKLNFMNILLPEIRAGMLLQYSPEDILFFTYAYDPCRRDIKEGLWITAKQVKLFRQMHLTYQRLMNEQIEKFVEC